MIACCQLCQNRILQYAKTVRTVPYEDVLATPLAGQDLAVKVSKELGKYRTAQETRPSPPEIPRNRYLTPSSRTCLEPSVYHIDLASRFWLGMAWFMFAALSLCLHGMGSIASLASCILLKALGTVGVM